MAVDVKEASSAEVRQGTLGQKTGHAGDGGRGLGVRTEASASDARERKRLHGPSPQGGVGSEKGTKAARKPSKAQRRKRTMNLHKALRLAIQIAFFALAPGVFSSAMSGVRLIFTQLGATQPIAFASFIITLAAALGYTILFGRFFCGYACSFGTMGDVLYLAGTPLRKLIHLEGKPIRGRVAAVLRWVKFAILAAICALCFTGMWSQISAHDPWTVFGLATAGEFSGYDAIGAALLVAIMVFQMLFERSFCRFLCPMGAVFSLMPVLPVSQYDRTVERCGKKWCNRCINNCPAGIYPDRGTLTAGECFECGRCADVCPLENVNLIVRMEQAVQQAETEGKPPAQKAEPAQADAVKADLTDAKGEAVESGKAAVELSGADSRTAKTVVDERAAAAAAVNAPCASSGDDSRAGQPAAKEPVEDAERADKPAEKSAAKPVRPKRAPKPKVKWRFKGSGAAWTLTRAGVLLAMLWLIGATRFLPDVSTVLPWLPWLA